MRKVGMSLISELESMLSAFGITVSVFVFLQLYDLALLNGLIGYFFKFIYEITILFFIFQLGALRAMREGASLETYFEEDGGLLVVFAVICLILCSLGTMLSGFSEYRINF